LLPCQWLPGKTGAKIDVTVFISGARIIVAACVTEKSVPARSARKLNAMNAGFAVGNLSQALPIQFERSIMKQERIRRFSLIAGLVIFVSGLWVSGSVVTAGGGNRCSDHCADRYKVAKDACRLIPLKTERKICERRAKEAKSDCKHMCR